MVREVHMEAKMELVLAHVMPLDCGSFLACYSAHVFAHILRSCDRAS
jgi:hypothetical protein